MRMVQMNDDLSWFFFFFQAEDGIRDYKVTGVQTCALPIYHEIDHRERRRWPGRSFVDERGLLVQALQRQADTGNRFVREPAPHLVGALIGQYQARPVRVESIVVECLIEQLDGADLFELEVNVAVLAGKPEIDRKSTRLNSSHLVIS